MTPTTTLAESAARVFGLLRGAMLVFFAAVFFILPEKAMPGSSSEPAQTLAIMLASRTALLGIGMVVLGLTARHRGLAWVLMADAALQVFDTGMALATDKGAMALLPAALGGLDAWAGVVLLRLATKRGGADESWKREVGEPTR